jgi:carboxymethylenebutenolidase
MPITKLTEEGSLKNYLCLLGALTVPSLLSFMTPNYVDSVLIKPGDPRLKSEFITYESPKGGGKIKALSQPTGTKKELPGIIVVHENRGLNPYIEDVGRRAAVEGFITLAPDALSPLGGYPGNDDDGRVYKKNGLVKKCSKISSRHTT